MSNRCLLFHKWPKWSAPYALKGRRYMLDYYWHDVEELHQDRTCTRCGKHQLRRVDHS